MLIFSNEGLIPIEAFQTFGINAKPNSTNPIGYFGTGLKYAVAVTLRLGGTFRLFRGEEEYCFYLKDTDFRGKGFQMVRMKKRKGVLSRWKYESLPFSTELGKNWEPWMAVRELESNTRDEDGSSWLADDETPHGMSYLNSFEGSAGVTTIHIDCPEMEEAYKDLHKIFMPEKKLLHSIGQLEIYEGHSDYLFFRGLRVTDFGGKPSFYTYNFTEGLTLTEDRTSKWPYNDMHTIVQGWMSMNDVHLIEALLDIDEDKFYEGSLPFDQPYTSPSPTYHAALGTRYTGGGALPKRMKSYYKDRLAPKNMEETYDLELTATEGQELLGGDVSEKVMAKIRTAMDDEEIPF